ncbi:MAG: hypothetical protein KatS3mg002_0067 [Candidatus Woesearchaeota archaeon]|nr:MAG: hypothetical protein KatS3mg002_0067 [Candidatus Woesearchaeota archaeon]
MRERYLKKFHELKLNNISGGLGIVTRTDWLDLDDLYAKKGSVDYVSNEDLFDEDSIKDLSKNISNEIIKIIENPVLENKVDYLHAALRTIKLLIIEKSGEYIIDKRFIGNQYSHLFVYIYENVDATIYITARSNDSSNNIHESINISTDFLDVIVSDNSRVNIVDLRNYNKNYFLYSRKKILIKNNADLKYTNVEGPSKLNLSETHSIIKGENSGSIMNTILLSRDSEYNFFTRTDHHSKNTKSLMQCRAALINSKVILRGLVYIGSNAFNSNGYQKNDLLVLDENSRAISIPDLKINNNEVRCTHGSSVSKIDKEKVFYLQSRGLSISDSEKLLVKGFYEKITSEVPNGLRDAVLKEIEEIFYERSTL